MGSNDLAVKYGITYNPSQVREIKKVRRMW